MKNQQIMKQVNDSNKIILEKTFALSQTAKLVFHSIDKDSSISETNKKIINKPGQIFKRDSSEYKMTLYKIAEQKI